MIVACKEENSIIIQPDKLESVSKPAINTSQINLEISKYPEYESIINILNINLTFSLEKEQSLSTNERATLSSLYKKYPTADDFIKFASPQDKDYFNQIFSRKNDTVEVGKLITLIRGKLSQKYSFKQEEFIKAFMNRESTNLKNLYVPSCEQTCQSQSIDIYYYNFLVARDDYGWTDQESHSFAMYASSAYYNGCLYGCING